MSDHLEKKKEKEKKEKEKEKERRGGFLLFALLVKILCILIVFILLNFLIQITSYIFRYCSDV